MPRIYGRGCHVGLPDTLKINEQAQPFGQGKGRQLVIISAFIQCDKGGACAVKPLAQPRGKGCWAALGHDDMVSTRSWPTVDETILVEETITLPVQINGKKRGELTIAIDASQADVETATLELDAVRRALDGQAPKKIVVVPKRIVNVVV